MSFSSLITLKYARKIEDKNLCAARGREGAQCEKKQEVLGRNRNQTKGDEERKYLSNAMFVTANLQSLNAQMSIVPVNKVCSRTFVSSNASATHVLVRPVMVSLR